MSTRTFTVLIVVMGLCNPIAAIINVVEATPDSEPGLLAAFAIPWLVAAALVHFGKVTAGAIVAGTLAVMNLVNAPTWTRTSVLDWTTQSIGVLGAAVCLVLAVRILVQRFRTAERLTGATR
jgi:hypothetical protein